MTISEQFGGGVRERGEPLRAGDTGHPLARQGAQVVEVEGLVDQRSQAQVGRRRSTGPEARRDQDGWDGAGQLDDLLSLVGRQLSVTRPPEARDQQRERDLAADPKYLTG